MKVNDDGHISFGKAISSQYTPFILPRITLATPFITPYWADVDTTKNNGRIYYRTVTGKHCEQLSKPTGYCNNDDDDDDDNVCRLSVKISTYM